MIIVTCYSANFHLSLAVSIFSSCTTNFILAPPPLLSDLYNVPLDDIGGLIFYCIKRLYAWVVIVAKLPNNSHSPPGCHGVYPPDKLFICHGIVLYNIQFGHV